MRVDGALMEHSANEGPEAATSKIPYSWISSEKGLYFLLALSFVLKGILLSLTEVISNDGPKYINPAYSFLEGNWLEAVKTSGTFFYSLLIAAFGKLGFDLVLAGELISLLSSVLVLVPLYRFFCGIANRNVAFWGGLAFAFSPSLNRFSVAVMRDPLFLLVFVWLVYFGWRALEEKKVSHFAWMSLLSILAPLLRLEGLLFLPIFFLVLTIKAFSDSLGRKLFVKRVGIFVSVLFLGSLIGYFLLSNENASLSHHWRVQQVRAMFLQVKERGVFYVSPEVTEKLREMEKVIPGGVSSNDFAEVARDHILLIYFIGFVSVIAENLWPPFFLVLLLGLVRLPALGKGLYFFLPLLLAFSFMAYWFSLNYGFLDERYTYASTVLLCLVVGIGLEMIASRLRYLPFPRAIFTFFLLAVICVPSVEAVKREAKPEALSSKEAGEWLAEQAELQGCSLASNGEKIPFYAGRGGNYVKAEFWERSHLATFVQRKKPDLVAFESRKSNLSGLSFPGYRIIAEFEDSRYICLIFRIEK